MTDELKARDDLSTLLALGVLAYTLETMIHELAGHGGVCLVQGHKLLLVTPLWMRCDVVSPLMVAAGPIANMVAALLSWILLRSGVAVTLKAPLFVWLCFTFNGLVAAGYLGVGGATAFGDWGYLFASAPAWLWRGGAVLVAAAAYWTLLRWSVSAYARFGGGDHGDLVRRAVVPALGAAVVAVAAQAYGQGSALAGFILPLACTAVVGASLAAMRDYLPGAAGGSAFRVSRNWGAIALAIAAAAGYILFVGKGLDFSRLA